MWLEGPRGVDGPGHEKSEQWATKTGSSQAGNSTAAQNYALARPDAVLYVLIYVD